MTTRRNSGGRRPSDRRRRDPRSARMERPDRPRYTSDLSEQFFQESDREERAAPGRPKRQSRNSASGRAERQSLNAALGRNRQRRPVQAAKPVKRPKRKSSLQLEKPWRLALALGVLVLLIILICVKVIGSSDNEKESGVQTITPEDGSSLGTEVPAASGRITNLDGIRNQMMGFFGSMVLSNIENYPHDPEVQEEALEETVPVEYTYCVVLDPSHGGEDAGNTYEDAIESTLVLDIAQEIRSAVQKLDSSIEVILTREADTYMEFSERAQVANEAGADLFVTIHCDLYTEDTSVSGISCQYWDSEESTERGQLSKAAAEKIAAELAGALDLIDYGAWSAVMEVLYETEMPSVALQFGYLSSETDRTILMDKELREVGVDAVAESIVEIVNSYTPDSDIADDAADDESGNSNNEESSDSVVE